jgi:geranylgeranyl diphosphate synthase, type I
MFLEIKNKIEQELKKYIRGIDRLYSISKISPVLFKNINDFLSRRGKRIRPILFVVGYLGFAKRAASGLYRTAVSLELLHDFMLVHDDIIDKSSTRRGKPSMHEMLNRFLSRYKNIKFNGQDLTIVIGDVLFAMSLNAFLSIKERLDRKEAALKKLIDAAMYTGSGEFIELLSGLKGIDKIKKSDIYKIYDYKTANYTFASPLAIGAILAGAEQSQIGRLFKYGTYLGRAFQIKDDYLGLFGEEKNIGKSTLTDLQEAKKTILIWQAYQNSDRIGRTAIKRILSKRNVTKYDLLKMRKITIESGALDYAKKEIANLIKKAKKLIALSRMRAPYKELLCEYCATILKL